MNYAPNLDYLVAAITYLGTHTYFWARTPRHMARELSLDEVQLTEIFEGFPGLFRKSQNPAPNSKTSQHFYSLQARYALREGPGTDEPEQVSYIAPLATQQVEQLLDFVLHAANLEQESRKSLRTNWIAVGCAFASAVTAVVVAWIKLGAN